MEDKLVKTGHKKAYYRLQKLGVFAISFISFAIVAVAPILITHQIAELARAEENESSSSIEISSIESSIETSEFEE